MPGSRLLLLLFLVAGSVSAQSSAPSAPSAVDDVVKGVVWRQPEDLEAALRDLQAMREAGVEAVRTDLITRAPILRMADLLGLRFYQDLPVADLPAARSADTLAYAERELDAALDLAQQHPSASAFGLARFVDTSDPATCAYLQTLADRVRSGGGGLTTYYFSHFIEDDVCAEQVDLVLLDARGHEPLNLIRRWRLAHDTPVGLGSFGAPVDDEVEGGYRTPHSPAAQARFVENGLTDLFSAVPPPVAVFVFLWRDGVEASYGLFQENDMPRPAFQVMRGFYTGRQRVFAFDAGPEPVARANTPTFVLVGWLIAIGLAVVLAFAPRFRQLVPRYFTRHAYYREALQRGRGAEGWASFGLAVVLAFAAGVIGAVVLHAATETDVVEALVGGLQPTAEARVLRLFGAPLLVVLLGGTLYGVWLLLNMLWLLALTGQGYRIRPAQALALATWSRWPVLVLMVGAVLAAVQPAAIRWVPFLLAAWGLVEVVATVRMLYDFSRVTRVPMPRALVLGLGAPLGIIAAVWVFALVAVRPELAFLWHLATRQ